MPDLIVLFGKPLGQPVALAAKFGFFGLAFCKNLSVTIGAIERMTPLAASALSYRASGIIISHLQVQQDPALPIITLPPRSRRPGPGSERWL
jgi:hypothetical protein